MQWLCFKTKNREEFVAKALLTMQGFEVILPYYMKTISHARKKSKIPYPLFPSYGFLLFDGNISSLKSPSLFSLFICLYLMYGKRLKPL